MEGHALFLDRDGAVNREAGCIFRKEDVQFVDGIVPLCRTAKKLGYRLVMLALEKGLARGVYTEADSCALMKWMREEFRRDGVIFDGIYRCPSGTRTVTAIDQPKYKPGAAMLCRAARDLHLSLAASVMVGSRGIDVAAANAGGLYRAFLLCGSERVTCGGAYTAVHSLGEVEAWLVDHGKGANLPPASQRLAVA